MSVEDSLQYFDKTLAQLDKVSHVTNHKQPNYESESDLLSEVGYASGYTELSVTSDSEQHPRPGLLLRRRKSRQNRNHRFQSDPILGDLESDSTNDGHLFGNGAVKTKTTSGQRRQRERRRQRRKNASRNSWTDSGLSLSKTDSQRSSHGENSPIKRGRSKTSPAEFDGDIVVLGNAEEGNMAKEVEDKGPSPITADSGFYSPNMDIEVDNSNVDNNDHRFDENNKENRRETVFALSHVKAQEITGDHAGKEPSLNGLDTSMKSLDSRNVVPNVESINSEKVLDSELKKLESDKKSHGAKIVDPKMKSLDSNINSLDSNVNSLDISMRSSNPSTKSIGQRSNDLDQSVFNIKPTNVFGVVNGTYSPKEKEIMRQVFANAQNSSNITSSNRSSVCSSISRNASASLSSRFPLPAHLDYPLPIYRREIKAQKDKKSPGGIMRGFKRLKDGITNKRKPIVARDNPRMASSKEHNIHAPMGENQNLPPSKSVEKKKNFLKRFFKSQSNISNSRDKSQNGSRRSQNFSRDRFGSSRSFSGSIGQLWSRGSRARSQSMENLKNAFRRDRGGSQIIKRSISSTSLAAKMPRSLSISSLFGQRGKSFTRHGSMVSVAAPCSRQQNSGFRRADSVRSLQGGFDIATRLLQSQNPHGEYYEESNENYAPSYAGDANTPFRGGWRPSSRASRRDTVMYEQQYYHEDDFVPYDDCYDHDGACSCCCDDQYTDNGYYYEDCDNYDQRCYDKQDYYSSRSTINQQYSDSPQPSPQLHRQSFSRMSSQPLISSTYAPNQQLAPNYYSPRSYRAESRMVVPLNVQVTQERRAERRQLSRASQVFDTFV